MKKWKFTIKGILFTCLFFALFVPLPAQAAETGNQVKIGLKYSSTAVSAITLRSESGFQLATVHAAGWEEGMPLPGYSVVTVAVEHGAITLRDLEGVLLAADLGKTTCVMPLEKNKPIQVENTAYRGGIMFYPNANSAMNIINYLSMTEYLYGVLPAEIPRTSPAEALKAQAVAARSFAGLNLNRHGNDGFDLCATTHCQVYNGYGGEHQETNQAADQTAGEVILHQGKPVEAFYFKNSGGYTQNAEDVWSNAQGYLQSVKDLYSPEYPWSLSLSFESLRQKLEAAGQSPGTIASIAITERNAAGFVSALQIEGSKGTVILKKEQIRNVLGATLVKSLRFDFTEGASTGNKILVSNGIQATAADDAIYAINSDGQTVKTTTDGLYGSNGTSVVSMGGGSSAQMTHRDPVTFTGVGYGHGVGMPQDSAIEMAKQGYTYQEILKYYYKGIEIY